MLCFILVGSSQTGVQRPFDTTLIKVMLPALQERTLLWNWSTQWDSAGANWNLKNRTLATVVTLKTGLRASSIGVITFLPKKATSQKKKDSCELCGISWATPSATQAVQSNPWTVTVFTPILSVLCSEFRNGYLKPQAHKSNLQQGQRTLTDWNESSFYVTVSHGKAG